MEEQTKMLRLGTRFSIGVDAEPDEEFYLERSQSHKLGERIADYFGFETIALDSERIEKELQVVVITPEEYGELARKAWKYDDLNR